MSSIPLPALAIQQPESPIKSMGQVLALKTMLGQQQEQQQNIQLTQQKIQDDKAMTASVKSLNWDGKDYDALSKEMLKNGASATSALAVQQHGLTIQKTVSDIASQDASTGSKNLETFIGKHKAIGDQLEGIEDVPDDQLHAAAASKLQELTKSGIIDPQTAQQFQQGIDATQDPKQLRSKIDMIAKQSMGAKEVAERAKTAQETEASKASEFKEIPGTGMFFNPITNQTKTPEGVALSPQMMESKYVSLQAQQNQGQKLSSSDQAFIRGYEKMKTLVPQFTFNMQQGALKGDALDMPAEMYFQTGQLPAGMRSPAMSAAIMTRAAALHPGGATELSGNKAAFAANQASYENVTKTLDTLSAFEQSGLKNLKQFTDLADKLPDTGIPWLNTPVRDLDQNVVGSQWMPAIKAAKEVALREIARVTNDPKLSGSLTDSARQEVQSLVPANATMNGIKNTVHVLINDMANVHSSLAQQKQDIGGRLGIKAGARQAGGGTGGGGGQTITQAQLEKAAKDHNVSVAEAKRQAESKGIEITP